MSHAPASPQWLHILEDKPVIHRPDCADRPASGGFDPDLTAGVADETIAYALTIRPAYEGLRSLLGQYAGLLLLAYASPRADYPDLEVMAAAAEQLRQTRDLLSSARCPQGGAAYHHGLTEAARLLEQAHDGMANGLRRPEQKEEAHRQLKAAQSLLHRAADTRFAMTMVDLHGSCCGCPNGK